MFLTFYLNNSNQKILKPKALILILPLEITKTTKVDLIIEMAEKEADVKTIIKIISANISGLLIDNETQNQILKSLKIISEKYESTNSNLVERLNKLELSIGENKVKQLDEIKIFELTAGNVSFTPTQWTNFEPAKGFVNLIEGKFYRMVLTITGQYTNVIWQMNFRVFFKDMEHTMFIPGDIGFQKYFSGPNEYINDIRENDFFTAKRTGKYDVQLQVWNRGKGYSYGWNGKASLYILEMN